MKEMLKSKVLLLFVAVVLGVTYMYASGETKLEENSKTTNQEYIAMNVR